MNKMSWRSLMVLSGLALLQGCVAYPVLDEPYYGGRGWDGPSHRHSPSAHTGHAPSSGHFSSPPRPREAERGHPEPRRQEQERGRWDEGRSRR
ncbi:hypothetical protein [Uliginosibacterium flavum]|uniref:Lipoprotein n=1 Tax=Uliginosibacterium flavum TaxID=1396831 RepID=A0ABV2TMQ3_9RHOO